MLDIHGHVGDPAPGPPLRFGIFLPPMHPVGQNPTLSIKRDLELIEHLDALGFDEAWIGEHHSSGFETIASPEVFIAAAAQRTKRIKLGTGVNSLPYHHPLILADRIVMLDHLTEGRMMFGVGPGQLTSDASWPGPTPNIMRPRVRWSSSRIRSARISGWWYGRELTPVPSLMWLVTAATWAMNTSGEAIVS